MAMLNNQMVTFWYWGKMCLGDSYGWFMLVPLAGRSWRFPRHLRPKPPGTERVPAIPSGMDRMVKRVIPIIDMQTTSNNHAERSRTGIKLIWYTSMIYHDITYDSYDIIFDEQMGYKPWCGSMADFPAKVRQWMSVIDTARTSHVWSPPTSSFSGWNAAHHRAEYHLRANLKSIIGNHCCQQAVKGWHPMARSSHDPRICWAYQCSFRPCLGCKPQ